MINNLLCSISQNRFFSACLPHPHTKGSCGEFLFDDFLILTTAIARIWQRIRSASIDGNDRDLAIGETSRTGKFSMEKYNKNAHVYFLHFGL